MAADGNPAVQMALPMTKMLGWLPQGAGDEFVKPGSG
jgi:hypothetical protein